MFIKKDRRRIDEILADNDDTKESLQLSKRAPEFNGNLRVLCRESNIPFLGNLRVLNLYDNALNTLTGIGHLSQTPLEELNLGCNNLSDIPLEFGSIHTLQSLWLDDNNFEEFPMAVCRLTKLKTLRMSGNQISELPDLISCLDALEVLAMDNNRLTALTKGVLKLPKLKGLWIRQNQLQFLPDDIEQLQDLETLSVSSNRLTNLPESIAKIKSIKCIYANSNVIEVLPSELCENNSIKEINVANNNIKIIPSAWEDKWGHYDLTTGQLKKQNESLATCKVTILGNPIQA